MIDTNKKQEMNNRGQITVALTVGVMIVIAVIILMIFVAGGVLLSFIVSNLWKILAVTIIVFGLIAAIKTNSTKVRNTSVAFIVGGLFILLLSTFGILQNAALDTGQYIQTPLWGYYKCDPAQAAVTESLGTLSYSTTVKTFTCPSNTDTCTITISAPSSIGIATTAIVSYATSTDSGQSLYSGSLNGYLTGTLFSGKTIPSVTLTKGETLRVLYTAKTLVGTPNAGPISLTVKYTPFTLWIYEPLGGGLFKSGTDLKHGCTFNAGEASKLIVSDTLGIGTGQSSSTDTLGFYQTRNFISGVIPISVDNSKFQDNGASYCMVSDHKLYPVKSISTVLYQYKVVDNNIPIKSVNCCNGEVRSGYNCVSNNWVAVSSGQAPADNFGLCPGSSNTVYDSKTLVRQVAVNGVCTQKFTAVECTTNTACTDANKPTCDLNSYTCVAAVSPETQPIVTPAKDINTQCKELQTKYPYLGYQYTEAKTSSCGFWCNLGFSEPTVTVVPQCKSSVLPYAILLISIGALVVIVYFITGKKARRK